MIYLRKQKMSVSLGNWQFSSKIMYEKDLSYYTYAKFLTDEVRNISELKFTHNTDKQQAFK